MNTLLTHDRNSWRHRRVLVTGATGIVGSQLVRRLLDLQADVTCFVRDHDPASALWSSGDIDRVAVISGRLEVYEHIKVAVVEREIDTIFHLGAQAIVGAGRRDPLGTFESNILGTCHILEACRLHGDLVKRIVIASSDKAYGECEALPYTEDTPLSASNPYDVSKACADLIAQSYFATYRLPVAIARCGNIFGPGDVNWSRIVPGTIRALLHNQPPVIRSDGSPVRDYLFVDDAVNAYVALANWLGGESHGNDEQRAFNFSSNRPLSVLQITTMIQHACGCSEIEPLILNQAVGEISAQHLDSTRAHRELRWSPRANFAEALATTVQWYREYFQHFSGARNPLSLPRLPVRPARASA